jgi:hypothetical protein
MGHFFDILSREGDCFFGISSRLWELFEFEKLSLQWGALRLS